MKIFTKSFLGFAVLAFLLGAQPSFILPQADKFIVKAQEATQQTQVINSASIPFTTQLPHPGYLTTYFYSGHPGIDIATGLGMPIKPVAEGTILDAGYNLFGLGLNVKVDHGYGYVSSYAHLGRIYVQKGQVVQKTDYLGEVGMTGNTTGPHTHLEISRNGTRIDPLKILPDVRRFPQQEDFKPVASKQTTTPVKPKPISTPTPIKEPEVQTDAKKEEVKAVAVEPAKPKLPSYLSLQKKQNDLTFVSNLVIKASTIQKKYLASEKDFQGGRYITFNFNFLPKENNIPKNPFAVLKEVVKSLTVKDVLNNKEEKPQVSVQPKILSSLLISN